ncbi:serine/threonine-protein phosphatase 7 long form homolog [Castanea sativa]|uniref:serine/threonine-protein phosphatase 7 long form homolog n=1 Tax=Castanea sativa TaxID=21020 RepID=UPI003F64A85C
MDLHGAGPSVQPLLTRQLVHCSSSRWDVPLVGEEVSSVLTCRHRFISVPEGGLDPQISAYIADVGLEGLLRVPNIDLDHALITTLVERWQLETHSFHLPHGEMAIMLQDMEVIIRVLVDDLPVVGFTHMQDWGNLCAELLGHRLPNRKVGASKNIAVMEGLRVKVC